MILGSLFLLLTMSNALNVDLWVDKDDAIYQPTENLTVYFRTNEDCFVAVYNVEQGGRVNRLFPLEGENGWVEAGRVYELPPASADYDYVIEGPAGSESIIALASREWLPMFNDERSGVVSETVMINIEEPEPSTLKIISTPEDCYVYMVELATGDEEYIGTTPRTIVIRPGEYLVRIKKSGYHTLTRKIWLEPGERRRVFVTLHRY
jgi:hypothetical protein